MQTQIPQKIDRVDQKLPYLLILATSDPVSAHVRSGSTLFLSLSLAPRPFATSLAIVLLSLRPSLPSPGLNPHAPSALSPSPAVFEPVLQPAMVGGYRIGMHFLASALRFLEPRSKFAHSALTVLPKPMLEN